MNMTNGLNKNRGIDKPTKKGKTQRTRDCENSNGSSRSGKWLTLFSQIQYTLCTECGMF